MLAAVSSGSGCEEALLCRNCEAPLTGRFCSKCGQRDKPLDPTMHEFLHEIVHEFAHLDGRIAATLRALIKPGQLTAEFLNGRRTRYIGPVRLYLTLSLLFFLIAAVKPKLPGSHLVVIGGGSPSAHESRPVKPVPNSWVARAAFKAAEHPQELEHLFLANISRMMFVMLPVFAAALRLIYRRTGRRYPAFLYFSVHYHAFLFGAGALAGLVAFTRNSALADAASILALIACTWYLFLALHRVFGGSAWGTAARMAATACLYFPVLFAGVIASGLISILTV